MLLKVLQKPTVRFDDWMGNSEAGDVLDGVGEFSDALDGVFAHVADAETLLGGLAVLLASLRSVTVLASSAFD